jgi:hypothetical protein
MADKTLPKADAYDKRHNNNGGPRGNHYALSHGLAVVRNDIKRRRLRGRSYIDHRSYEGQEALKIQAGLVEDSGGVDAVTTARFVAIQELTNLYYLGAMMDRSTKAYLDNHPEYKNPRALARLFSYRAPVTASIAKYLTILGLDKRPPPAKSLDEILSEEDNGSADGAERGPL